MNCPGCGEFRVLVTCDVSLDGFGRPKTDIPADAVDAPRLEQLKAAIKAEPSIHLV